MSGTPKLSTYARTAGTPPAAINHALAANRWFVIPAVTLAMLLMVMAYAAATGSSFGNAMSAIWAEPWGKAVVVDVYAGLILAGAWIGWREPTMLRASGWWLALALTGNMATCVYVLLALRASQGSAQRFFCGSGR